MDCKPRLQATGFGKNNTDACGLIPETSIYPGVTVTENHSNELRRVAPRDERIVLCTLELAGHQRCGETHPVEQSQPRRPRKQALSMHIVGRAHFIVYLLQEKS